MTRVRERVATYMRGNCISYSLFGGATIPEMIGWIAVIFHGNSPILACRKLDSGCFSRSGAWIPDGRLLRALGLLRAFRILYPSVFVAGFNKNGLVVYGCAEFLTQTIVRGLSHSCYCAFKFISTCTPCLVLTFSGNIATP